MPIQVQGPDGQLLEFPDGTDRETMRAAMAKRYGGPTQPRPDFSNVTSGATTQPRQPQQPPEPPRGNPVTRALGEIGGRQVLQGAAGLYGALGGDALNYYVLDPVSRATGVPLGTGSRTYREAASDLADNLGMRAPQTSGQRIASDVGEALAGTGLTMGIGGLLNIGRNALAPSVSSRVGNFLTAQPGLQAASTATGSGAASGVREGGGSEGQQLAAGLVGGLAPGVAGATTAASVRGLVRGRDGSQMQRTIQDFGALGADVSVGQASGNRVLQGAENILAGGPTSAGVMGRFAERQAENIGDGLQNTARNLSRNPSAETAGEAVQRGVAQFRGNSRAQQRALYWQADQHIPDQSPVNVQQTWQELVRLTTPTQGATATTGAMIHPRIAQLRDNLAQDVAAGNGQIPYSALRAIRSQIGEQISDFSMTPDAPTRQLRQLYSALSRDMEAVARATGPQAEQAARRANNYTHFLNNRLERLQRVVDKEGGGEAIYNAVLSGSRDGGTTLRRVMRSLPREDQRAVTAAVIRRMGLATPGAQDAAGDVFSANTFLTKWNQVSPEAKSALFGPHGDGFARDMDRVARVAANIKEGSKVFANPSGTANRAAAIGYGLTLGGSIVQAFFTGNVLAPVSAIGGGMAANYAARKLTDPDFVRWLATSTAMPIGTAPAQFNALRRIGEKNDDPEMIELANVLEEQYRAEENSGTRQQ